MSTPESGQYKDLHGGMMDTFPKVTEARIEEYLTASDKKLDNKSKAMYKERCIFLHKASNYTHLTSTLPIYLMLSHGNFYQ